MSSGRLGFHLITYQLTDHQFLKGFYSAVVLSYDRAILQLEAKSGVRWKLAYGQHLDARNTECNL